MKFIFTKHAIRDKLPILKKFGWTVSRSHVEKVVKHPRWSGFTKKGQKTAMGIVDETHILRVIFGKKMI
jgi:hypothetical protein